MPDMNAAAATDVRQHHGSTTATCQIIHCKDRPQPMAEPSGDTQRVSVCFIQQVGGPGLSGGRDPSKICS